MRWENVADATKFGAGMCQGTFFFIRLTTRDEAVKNEDSDYNYVRYMYRAFRLFR